VGEIEGVGGYLLLLLTVSSRIPATRPMIVRHYQVGPGKLDVWTFKTIGDGNAAFTLKRRAFFCAR
jgi:hypothetical protein